MNTCAFCGGETSGRRRICDRLECIEKMKRSWYEESIAIPDGYLTVSEFAKKNQITTQAVSKNCRAGKYPGAFQDEQSGRWYVPKEISFAKHNPPKLIRRKKRLGLKATDKEWNRIVELAAQSKYSSINEFILKKALEKDMG